MLLTSSKADCYLNMIFFLGNQDFRACLLIPTLLLIATIPNSLPNNFGSILQLKLTDGIQSFCILETYLELEQDQT